MSLIDEIAAERLCFVNIWYAFQPRPELWEMQSRCRSGRADLCYTAAMDLGQHFVEALIEGIGFGIGWGVFDLAIRCVLRGRE